MRIHRLTVSATAADGSLISPRCGHSATAITGPNNQPQVFLFGGASHEQGPMSDGWILELNGSQFLSHSLERSGSDPWPVERYEHLAVNISGQKSTLLFGGSAALEGRLMNDLWLFDWERRALEPLRLTDGSAVPEGRTLQYAACLCNRQTGKPRLFLWSGGGIFIIHIHPTKRHYRVAEAGRPLPDEKVWVLDVESKRWLGLPLTNNLLPKLRQGHSIVGWQQFLVVFGGLTVEGESLNDLWLYDTERNQWTELTAPTGSSSSINKKWPTGRSGHAAALLHDRWLVISGGLSLKPPSATNAKEQPSADVLADVWLFDLSNRSWQLVPGSDQQSPLQRFSHRLVPLAINDKEAYANMRRLAEDNSNDGSSCDFGDGCVEKLLMIGGMNLQGVFNDFWLIDPWGSEAFVPRAASEGESLTTESAVATNQLNSGEYSTNAVDSRK